MKSSDCCQPSRSIAPYGEVAPGRDRRVEDLALERRVLGEVRHEREGRVEPDLRVGRDLVHGPQRRVGERGERVLLRGERLGARHEAGPRQRHDVVDRQHDRLDARVLELDRLVVGEAGRGVDGALLERGRLAEVGELDDLDVVDCEVRRTRAAPGA